MNANTSKCRANAIGFPSQGIVAKRLKYWQLGQVPTGNSRVKCLPCQRKSSASILLSYWRGARALHLILMEESYWHRHCATNQRVLMQKSLHRFSSLRQIFSVWLISNLPNVVLSGNSATENRGSGVRKLFAAHAT